MKLKLGIAALLFIVISNAKAQVVLQGFAGNDGYEFSSFVQKDITKDAKLSYFGTTDYFAGYDSRLASTAEIFQTIN
jgi:hypothetical protein